MKSFCFTLFFLLGSLSTYAQKSYVHIYAGDLAENGNILHISGDIPTGIKKSYSSSDKMTIGEMLNILSDKGYELEYMSGTSTSSSARMCYVLSKNKSGSPNAIRSVKSADDSEVYEVARFNLQGLPISENEKGIQIIVYSNYTTKTIIRE